MKIAPFENDMFFQARRKQLCLNFSQPLTRRQMFAIVIAAGT